MSQCEHRYLASAVSLHSFVQFFPCLAVSLVSLSIPVLHTCTAKGSVGVCTVTHLLHTSSLPDHIWASRKSIFLLLSSRGEQAMQRQHDELFSAASLLFRLVLRARSFESITAVSSWSEQILCQISKCSQHCLLKEHLPILCLMSQTWLWVYRWHKCCSLFLLKDQFIPFICKKPESLQSQIK